MSSAFLRVFQGLSVMLLLSLLAAGCGGEDLAIGGSLPPVPTVTEATPTPTPDCLDIGEICVLNADCCSGVCLFNGCQ